MTTEIQPRRVAGQLSLLPVEVEQTMVREQRRPWTAMGLILIAAAAERMAAHLTGEEQALAYGTAAAAFVLAVVIGARSRHRLMGKHLRRRFMAAVWGAAGWLTYVAAAGLTWGAAATLMAVGSLLSLLFWERHRVYGRPAGPALELAEVDDDNMYVQRWRQNLGRQGRKLAGSKLTEMQMIRSGYRFTLELVPGEHTVSQVQGLIAALRSGLRLMPGQDLIVERHPEQPEPAALLTIVTKSTVATDQLWPGPDLAFDGSRGSVVMGPFTDGEGHALWSTYRKDGMFGGFIQGGIGSGKSRLIETIALALASSTTHPTTVWFACGQGGASSPLLMKRATATAATAGQFLEMMKAAVAVMDINGIENQEQEANGFHPTTARPGLLVIADEFHNFLDERQHGDIALEIQDLMVTIIREGRKAGVALLLATQEPLLPAFGHPSKAELMRSNLLVGNGVMMRSETNNAKQVFKVEVNARDFPDLPGYAYLARPFPGDRQAPFRAFFVNDQAIVCWATSFTWRVLSKLQESAVAEEAGRWYADRHKLAQARSAGNAARLARLRAGAAMLREDVERRQEQERTGVVVTPGRAFGENMPGVDEVTKFWESTSAPAHEASAAERALSDGHQKVLSAIRSGAGRPAAIMEATGLGKTRVHELLKGLVAAELIDQPTYGLYAPVGGRS